VSAGLPGIGLGGLFFILSALAAPLVELARTARGQSSVARWLHLGRQFALAVAMIAAVDVKLRLVYMIVSGDGFADPSPGGALSVALTPSGLSAGLLATLLATAKGMELAARARSRQLRPLPVRARLLWWKLLLGGAGALAAVWFALLGFGASGLSPLSDGVLADGPAAAAEDSDGANVGGAGSADRGRLALGVPIRVLAERERAVRSVGGEPVPEARFAPIADGNDQSLPPSSSGGEGGGAVDPPPVPGGPDSGAPSPDPEPAPDAVPPPSTGPPTGTGGGVAQGPPELAGPPEGVGQS
jgi:hypothetical protein